MYIHMYVHAPRKELCFEDSHLELVFQQSLRAAKSRLFGP